MEYKSMLERFKEHLEKHPDSIKDYFERLNRIEAKEMEQVERFHLKYVANINGVIEKLINKYESDYYVNKWYKLGIEPPRPLLHFLYKYAEKYGKETFETAHICEFNNIAYYIGDYVIRILHGQGSFVQVYKKN